ncbi:MAG: chloride channel protein, partial [Oscillospiraceae bacterium]|nr:chloride channel protein [Oscillospiraceae bacterium]
MGSVAIVLLYRLFRLAPDVGTNLVIEAVRDESRVPVLLDQAMFLSTLLTQLLGGSAGREGAAPQIGGGLTGVLARLFRVKEEHYHLLNLCGMAAVFSALFGTPVAAVFVLEVASVGHFHYSALLPCVCASATAGWLSRQLGGEVMRLSFPALGETGALLGLQTAALAVLCALLSIGFCVAVHGCDELAGRYLKNSYVRAL